jgi:hypothetical protein
MHQIVGVYVHIGISQPRPEPGGAKAALPRLVAASFVGGAWIRERDALYLNVGTGVVAEIGFVVARHDNRCASGRQLTGGTDGPSRVAFHLTPVRTRAPWFEQDEEHKAGPMRRLLFSR